MSERKLHIDWDTVWEQFGGADYWKAEFRRNPNAHKKLKREIEEFVEAQLRQQNSR